MTEHRWPTAPNGAPIETLAEVLSAGIALGDEGEAVDGLGLIAAWVENHYADGGISLWLDAKDAFNRLADRLGYEHPDLRAIADWLDPLPTEPPEPIATHIWHTRPEAEAFMAGVAWINDSAVSRLAKGPTLRDGDTWVVTYTDDDATEPITYDHRTSPADVTRGTCICPDRAGGGACRSLGCNPDCKVC